METVRRKRSWQISNSLCRSYQAHLTWWVHLIFTQIIHSQIHTRQRRTFSTFFIKDRSLELLIANFENVTSQICCAESWEFMYERLDQKWLDIQFFFLSKNDINFALKIPLVKFYRFITPQTHIWHDRCVAFWNLNCVS